MGVLVRQSRRTAFRVLEKLDKAKAGQAAGVILANYRDVPPVWTVNLPRAHRIADRVQSGTVWVNCWMVRDLRVPFGGMKSSGVGREGGLEALRFFTEPKNVCIKL